MNSEEYNIYNMWQYTEQKFIGYMKMDIKIIIQIWNLQ